MYKVRAMHIITDDNVPEWQKECDMVIESLFRKEFDYVEIEKDFFDRNQCIKSHNDSRELLNVRE